MRVKQWITLGLTVGALIMGAQPTGANPVPDREFLLAIQPGITSLSEGSRDPIITVQTNYYFLSQDIRMNLGTHLIFPEASELPESVTHFLGIEYNIAHHSTQYFVGIRRYKSYFLKQKNSFNSEKGIGYYLGMRTPLSPNTELILECGTLIQPFNQAKKSLSTTLTDRPLYLNFGLSFVI